MSKKYIGKFFDARTVTTFRSFKYAAVFYEIDYQFEGELLEYGEKI